MDFGLIAEDVEEIYPELVVKDNEDKPLGVRYDMITLLLLQAIKEMRVEIDDLKSRVN